MKVHVRSQPYPQLRKTVFPFKFRRQPSLGIPIVGRLQKPFKAEPAGELGDPYSLALGIGLWHADSDETNLGFSRRGLLSAGNRGQPDAKKNAAPGFEKRGAAEKVGENRLGAS